MTPPFRYPLLMLLSLFVAAVVAIMPLPSFALAWRPVSVSVILIYWSLRYPQHFRMIFGWMVGLLWDVLLNVPLGLHAMLLSLQGYLVIRLWQRLQMYPVVQQAFVVFLVVGIQLMGYRWVLGVLGLPASDLGFLWGAVTSALLWVPVRMVLDRLTSH